MYNTKSIGVLLKTPKEKERIHNYYIAHIKKLQYIYNTLCEQIARPQKYVFMHVSIENPWIFKQNFVKLDAQFVLSTNTVEIKYNTTCNTFLLIFCYS